MQARTLGLNLLRLQECGLLLLSICAHGVNVCLLTAQAMSSGWLVTATCGKSARLLLRGLALDFG